MDFLIRLSNTHLDFRKLELDALSELFNLPVEYVDYNLESPFCLVRLPSRKDAQRLVSRSVLSHAVYELWGQGADYPSLHAHVKDKTQSWWPAYNHVSFRFSVQGFRGKRDNKGQREIIESFSYLGFRGPIKMNNPDEEFCVLEEYELNTPAPKRIFLTRHIGQGSRDVFMKYDLKKRKYISTTSMDAELALITANIALASPGKLFFDPFMGTAGFPIACSHFGAITFGSDIDGRSVRGKKDCNPHSNFVQYGLTSFWLDSFVSDLTNTPLRSGRWLDGIVCDPPYGVREGLKVLGSRSGDAKVVYDENGLPTYLASGYIPPKKPYSFEAMLDDILQFGAEFLVDNGRLCMWMPTADGEDVKLAIPQNPYLELVSSGVQHFNKCQYEILIDRLPELVTGPLRERERKAYEVGVKADELNNFRKRFFEGFRDMSPNHQ